jgi:hypothetical protein
MSYTTQAALAEYLTADGLVQLTDDAGTGSADATKVTAAIEGAEDEVNGMLAGLYTVPLTGTVPGVVEEITRQLATLRALQQRDRPPPPARHQLMRGRQGLDPPVEGLAEILQALGPAQRVRRHGRHHHQHVANPVVQLVHQAFQNLALDHLGDVEERHDNPVHRVVRRRVGQDPHQVVGHAAMRCHAPLHRRAAVQHLLRVLLNRPRIPQIRQLRLPRPLLPALPVQ